MLLPLLNIAHLTSSTQLDKYKKADFGKCPRVLCESQPLLPTGLSDLPGLKSVKLYCPKCEDLYNPKSSRHAAIDGAYFGSSFHNILFQVYPALVPPKSKKRHQPKIFGFKVHAAAALARWQDENRRDLRRDLKSAKVADGTYMFVEDENSDDGMDDVHEVRNNNEEDELGLQRVGGDGR